MLPSGTVTFVFTDIEGSTGRWDANRGAMEETVRQHDALIRAEICAHNGVIFKTIGDAFCAVFSRPQDALLAAAAAQRTLSSEDFSAGNGLAVRFAVHTGTADERDGDYFGPDVNRVARLLAIGYGGQILVSNVTADLARSAMPPEIELRDLGEHHLKDVERLERVQQLIGPGLRAEFPPLRSIDLVRTNLSTRLTSFVGRDAEVAEIRALLQSNRLVTLIGPGGVGKTSTAVRVALEVADDYTAGVWNVELAQLQDGGSIPSAVAFALGITLADGDPAVAVAKALSAKSLLLILDNCEHIVAATACFIDILLQRAPNVTILSTSRQPLAINGEITYRISALGIPTTDAAQLVSVGEARRYDAVVLFEERARSVDRHFVLSEANAPSVAQIVLRLDGIPLAIELAAARVAMFAPAEILQRLEERFRILTSKSRSVQPRQQTLRALIDWSYDLLDERERALLARLSVFVGGWTARAAGVVCADQVVDAFDIIDLLASLVEKSLVVADTGGTVSRYHLLESTRAYAMEKLEEANARPRFESQYALWMAVQADELYERLWSGTSTAWRSETMEELGNARGVLRLASIMGDWNTVGRTVTGFYNVWYEGGLTNEGRRWAELALKHLDESESPRVVARLWLVLADLSEGAAAMAAAERAIRLFETLGDTRELGISFSVLALATRNNGDLEKSLLAGERACAILVEGDLSTTPAYARALNLLAGTLTLINGREEEAAKLYTRALELVRRTGDERGALYLQAHIARMEFNRGNEHQAIASAQATLQAARRLGALGVEADVLVDLAGYHVSRGAIEEGSTYARRALELSRQINESATIVQAIDHIAVVRAAQGDFARAAILAGYADAWRRREGLVRDAGDKRAHEALEVAFRKEFGSDKLTALAERGAALTAEQAIQEAIQTRSP